MSYIRSTDGYAFDSGTCIEVWGKKSDDIDNAVYSEQMDDLGIASAGVSMPYDAFNDMVVNYVFKKYGIDLKENSNE